MQHLKQYLTFAHTLADAAKTVTLPYFQQDKSVEIKPDNSPVTVADKRCEQTLRAAIQKHYPNHAILGEEYGAQTANGPFQWVIDPIDGTRSFIANNPRFGTLIALLYEGKPVVNLIDMPALNQRFTATINTPCLANGKVVQSSEMKRLANASLAWTDDAYFLPEELHLANGVKDKVKHTIKGGDCYLFTRLASGEIDLVIEAGLKPWDYMALILIVEKAGGVMTDWQNNPLTIQSFQESRGRVLAAANPTLHQQARQLLNKKA
ncbi:MAG: histidinol phosphate phosphatase [Gammaproteobacteria bacterium]|nr:MAG: histidinol phosphate phosphatase [Gammaproteobacteria bacterium]